MNFSPLRSYETIFSPYLSFGIKNEISQSMLAYRDTIRKDPLLTFAITVTADTSIKNRHAVLPHLASWRTSNRNPAIAGSLRSCSLYLRHILLIPKFKKIRKFIDWNATRENALAEQIKNTSTNPYGVENFMWWYFDQITLPEPLGSNDDVYQKALIQLARVDRFQNPFDRSATTRREAAHPQPSIECASLGSDGCQRKHAGYLLR